MPDPHLVISTLGKLIDPESGLSIADLGLIEHLSITPSRIRIDLLEPSPDAPRGALLLDLVRAALFHLAARPIEARLLSSPAWTPDRLSPAARRHLGEFCK